MSTTTISEPTRESDDSTLTTTLAAGDSTDTSGNDGSGSGRDVIITREDKDKD
ncbi:MAG: hypothetical protein H6710_09815 [Myxococcales bacterium]|nr:hypothetical protein [Myxococcales bacterium]MCB9700642.1 hypothetical protein [Myxococcales bacterium]